MKAFWGHTTLLGVSLAVASAGGARADSPPLPVVMRCSALSVQADKNPAYSVQFALTSANNTLRGSRDTLARPGKEFFSGTVTPNGTIQLTGEGSYFSGKDAPWHYEFSGSVRSDEAILKGSLHGVGHPEAFRYCSLSFTMPPAKVAEALGLPKPPQLDQIAEKQKTLETKQDQMKQSQTAESAAVNAKQRALETNQQQLNDQQSKTADDVKAVQAVLGGIILPATADPRSWMMRVAAVPIQQQQFCRIVDRFYDDIASVYATHNDIKINALFRERKKDMAALLPKGEFTNWVVQIKEVKQAADGSAGVILQPPCRAMLGSDICQKDGAAIRATIPADSPPFRELSRVNAGDFVVVSGKLIYAQSAELDPSVQQAVYPSGSYCSAINENTKQDVFVTQIDYLVQLK